MRFLKIEIEEFGCLRDQLFLLGEGLNLIEGANESGKSTLLAFLRFALYGFPRKSGTEGEEREKRLSWQGQRAAGKLYLQNGVDEFCISRAVVRQGSSMRESFSESLSVTHTQTGKEIAMGALTPGEYFLGLPAMLYDSTLCLRQSDAARVSDPGVSEAVSELMFAGLSGVGADVAQEKLRLARRELRHQKGRGGRIADLEDAITASEEVLRIAKEDAAALATLRAEKEKREQVLAERRREAEEISAYFEQRAIGEALSLFERARTAEACARQKKLNLEAQQAASAAKADISPQICSVREALYEHDRASREVYAALPELSRVRNVRHDDQMIAAHALILEKGGADAVLSDFQKAQKARRRARKAAVWMLVLFFAFAAVTALSIWGVLTPVWALFLSQGALPWLTFALLGADLLTLILTVSLFVRATRKARRVRTWLRRLHVDNPRMFRTYLGQCATEAQNAEAHRMLLQALESTHAQRQERADLAWKRVCDILADMGLDTPSQPQEVPAMLVALEEELRAVQQALLAARMEYERAVAAYEALTRPLEGKNEAELRERYREIPHVEADATELRRKQAFLKEAIAGLEQKYAQSTRDEIALASTAHDPSAVEAELAANRSELADAQQRLAAIELALQALAEATQSLREGLLPRVCQAASAYLEMLSEGAYQKLYPGTDLSISLDSPRGPLPLSHFSAGCRDAAHLSLRLGLLDTLCETPLPLLFDEALSRLDDARARALLALLYRYSAEGRQVLLFTCHGREAAFLAGKDITYFELQ